jgi:formylmethanofuran dehydrogenase subunit B
VIILAEDLIPDVVCTICGTGCDDIQVKIRDGKIVEAKNACAVSMNKFLKQHPPRYNSPMIRQKDELKPAMFEDAISKAASILSDAKYPILLGWSLTSTEATCLGVELAELVGGVIDNNTGFCHGPGLIGAHDIGVSTCTLGQVRHRADVIVYWASNPVHAHPRHIARYTVLSKGRFRKDRKERKMIVVDVRKTDTAKMADLFIQVEPNGDYELLSALRMAVKGEELEQSTVAGVSSEKIEELADTLVGCEFGVLFYGVGLTMSQGKSRNLDAALSLVRDLNNFTKFLIMPMRGHFNVCGANEVTSWSTGYPYAVDLSHGYPFYNPGETSAVDILLRGECDAALIVSSDPVSHLPRTVVESLSKIPIITLDPHITPTTMISDVVFPTAITGIETGGSLYRMDGVVLETKRLLDPPRGVKTDVEVLKGIFDRIRSLKGA